MHATKNHEARFTNASQHGYDSHRVNSDLQGHGSSKGFMRQSPGSIIAQIIADRKCENKEFARELGISAPLLSMLVQNKRRLSSAVIGQLARVTDITETEWHNIQDTFTQFDRDAKTHQGFRFSAGSNGGVLSDADIFRARTEGFLGIEPFHMDNLGPASIDLCLGETERFGRIFQGATGTKPGDEGGHLDRAKREEILINPGDTWKVWTIEKLTMPDNMCGRIAANSELILHGIQVGFGVQVDPLWSGKPFLLLSHFGDEPYPIDFGHPFVSMEIRMLTSPCGAPLG